MSGQPDISLKPDFLIGQRGGDWYAFYNTLKARNYIRAHGVLWSKSLDDVKESLTLLNFSWRVE